MPLPIIVFLESHIDEIIASHYTKMIQNLIGKGYNKFCIEAPSELSLDEIKLALNLEISEVEKLLTEAVDYINLGYKTTNPNSSYKCTKNGLLSLDITSLANILKMYVSLNRSAELALKFKSHLTNNITLEMFNQLSSKIDIIGIDVERTFSVMEHAKHKETREDLMFSKLLESYNNGFNIIFKVGKLHGLGLYERFKKEQRLDNIIFVDLSSPQTILPPLSDEQVEFFKNPKKTHKIFFESTKTIAKQLRQLDSLTTPISKPMLPSFDAVVAKQTDAFKKEEAEEEEMPLRTLSKQFAQMKS